jgi:hypothetical protein
VLSTTQRVAVLFDPAEMAVERTIVGRKVSDDQLGRGVPGVACVLLDGVQQLTRDGSTSTVRGL